MWTGPDGTHQYYGDLQEALRADLSAANRFPLMAIDDRRLDSSLASLRPSDLIAGESEQSIRRVVEAVRDIFHADGGGLMLVDEDDDLHYVGTPDDLSAAFEAAQIDSGQGPCVDSLDEDTSVETEDLGADERWPELRARLGDAPLGAVLGIPVHLGGSAIGSLNVFRTRPGTWDDSERRAIAAYRDIVEELLGAVVVLHQRTALADQLAHALENRVTIERAVGVVMARRNIDATRAFHHLRLRARNERRRVHSVAEEILAHESFAPDDHPDEDRTDGDLDH